ncbi:hypothetical protein WMC41_08185 [Shinella yambaruensis]|uniref:hypothetical protein n=1 Tax=Shinella yambaruensis TaxID=415996 RepID=UPI003D7B9143
MFFRWWMSFRATMEQSARVRIDAPKFHRGGSAMLERAKERKKTDKTLMAAAVLIFAGLTALGVPPFLLFGT